MHTVGSSPDLFAGSRQAKFVRRTHNVEVGDGRQICEADVISIACREAGRGADVHSIALRGNWRLRVACSVVGIGARSLSLGSVTSTGKGKCSEWTPGQRVVVCQAAGPRLSGKYAVVLGFGATRSRLRLLLDGSRGPITLHVSFVYRVAQVGGEGCDDSGEARPPPEA
jgi:hypothetical protein